MNMEYICKKIDLNNTKVKNKQGLSVDSTTYKYNFIETAGNTKLIIISVEPLEIQLGDELEVNTSSSQTTL